MIKYKKAKHPAYDRFLYENDYGISKIEEIVKKTLQIYSKLYIYFDDDYSANVSNMPYDLKKYLSGSAIDLLEKSINEFGKQDKLLRGSHNARDYEYNISFFGDIKVGERSKNTLEDDILTHHIKPTEDGQRMKFDLDDAIGVGLFIQKDGIMDNFLEDKHVHFAFDFSTVLLRLINSRRYEKHEELLEEDIISSLISKMIRFELIRPIMLKIMRNNSLLNKPENFKYDNPYTKAPASDIIKLMMIYKITYNAVNGLVTRDLEKSIKEVMDLVDLNIMSMGMGVGLDRSICMIRDHISRSTYDLKRPIDDYIDYIYDVARFALNGNTYHNDENKDAYKNMNIDNRHLIGQFRYSLEASETLVREAFNGLGITSKDIMNVVESFNQPAIESIEGFENFDSISYDQFIRTTRSQLLSKLSNRERKKFIDYESDILKLKMEINNCEEVEVQESIINKANRLGSMINTDASRYSQNDLIFKLLMMLDTYRADLINQLGKMSFINAKKNKLYGIGATRISYNL